MKSCANSSSAESYSDADVSAFRERLLEWYDRHGRGDLPWRNPASPYRVWVSEIMLQQTQVATVIPYYQRFMSRFPDAPTLAAASLDEVLRHWAGLGYYARARNLHRAARLVCELHAGHVPDEPGGLMDLPGVGRSTAGAILAVAHNRRAPILDGNVKRVLARRHGIRAWPGLAAVNRRLWALSERYTPKTRVADYTQAIMDLGATRCTPRRPRCGECPVGEGCVARQMDCAGAIPAPRPAKSPPVRRCYFLILRDGEGRCYLQRNPPAGLWGGLWCFPRFDEEAELRAACLSHGIDTDALVFGSPRRHTFSHFHLDYSPVAVGVSCPAPGVAEAGPHGWFHPSDPHASAVPAPIARLLAEMTESSTTENRACPVISIV
jgi:A/G-specific adenine glycosylase